MTRRGHAPLVGAAALFAALVPNLAAAEPARPTRPYDAPALEGDRINVPALPPEYLVQEENGIRFAYHPLARERVRPLIARASAIRSELYGSFGRDVLTPIEIRVAAAPAEMARLAPVELPSYVTAVAFSKLHLVVMSLGSPLSLEPPDLEDWLKHELAHIALDDAVASRPLPRWFHEGYAVEISGENAAARAETLCVASFRERILPLNELESQFPADAPQSSIAYAQSADFVRFLVARSKRDRLLSLLERVRGGEAFDSALAAAYGSDLSQLEVQWRRELAKRFAFLPVLLGATLLWLAVALAVYLRRFRGRRNAVSARRGRRASDREREREGRIAVVTARARSRSRDTDELLESMPPEPEVPKVEHDGRWYTLH